MRLPACLFILCFTCGLAACNRRADDKTGRTVVRDVVVEDISATEEEPPPPPPPPPPNNLPVTSPFASVQAWLYHICDRQQQAADSVISFGLLEAKGRYTLLLFGVDRKNDLGQQPAFNPAMAYPYPKGSFNNLERQQVWDSITTQLKNFTKTEKFSHSFFAKAKVMVTSFGGVVWER